MSLRIFIAAATILACPIVATSQPVTPQPVTGFYTAAAGGVTVIQHEIATLTTSAGTATWPMPPQVGPAFAIATGYGFGNGLRAELAADFRFNSFPASGAGGEEQKFGPMANILYDFTGVSLYVQPYLGLGTGVQWVQDRNLYATSGYTVATAATETKANFALQGIVGGAVPIGSVPGLAFTADYRCLGLIGDGDADATLAERRVTIPANLRLTNNVNHSVLIGFRYAFGEPSPK